MARPTKYSPARLGQVTKYLNKCRADDTLFPSIDDLALEMGLDDDTIVEWAKQYPPFSAAIKSLKRYQKHWLQSRGIAGKVNTPMAIFLLKANHGLVDVQRQEITGKDGGPVEQNQNLSVTYMPEPLEHDYYATGKSPKPADQ